MFAWYKAGQRQRAIDYLRAREVVVNYVDPFSSGRGAVMLINMSQKTPTGG